jgi:hypothetical protein
MSGGSANLALYERARGALPAHPLVNVPLAHPGLQAALSRIADRFGYGLR